MKVRRRIFTIFRKGARFISRYRIAKIHFVRVIYNWLYTSIFFRLKPDSVEVQGFKMRLDPKDRVFSDDLLTGSIWEQFETQIFMEEVHEGSVVLDIGANIGYYTLIASKLVGESGKVFAFEPDPANFTLLRENVVLNDCRNVVLVQKAVSNETGNIRLYISEDNPGDHRIYDLHDNRKFIEVEAVKLDDYFEGYDRRIDFIKIDIEGAEPSAIQGMTLLLQRNRNLKMITEFWPKALREFGIEPKEYLVLLYKLGFRLYRLSPRSKEKRPLNPGNIDKSLEMKDSHVNLLCIKEN